MKPKSKEELLKELIDIIDSFSFSGIADDGLMLRIKTFEAGCSYSGCTELMDKDYEEFLKSVSEDYKKSHSKFSSINFIQKSDLNTGEIYWKLKDSGVISTFNVKGLDELFGYDEEDE